MNTDKPKRIRWDTVAFVAMVVCGLAFVGLAYVTGPRGVPREGLNRSHCVNNLKQLGIALHNYHDTFKKFPPPYVAGPDGEPMHSWRILLLPYIEEPGMRELYEEYSLDEPWYSPHNQQLADKMPRLYRCPSDIGPPNEASYLAVVGPETGWSATQAYNVRDLRDGTQTTIALVEVANSGINWLDPRDLSLDQAIKSLESGHSGGANHLFFDGSVHFLKSDIDRKVYRALMSANGREVVSTPE